MPLRTVAQLLLQMNSPDRLVILTEEIWTHAMPAEKVLAQPQHIVAGFALAGNLLLRFWLRLCSSCTATGTGAGSAHRFAELGQLICWRCLRLGRVEKGGQRGAHKVRYILKEVGGTCVAAAAVAATTGGASSLLACLHYMSGYVVSVCLIRQQHCCGNRNNNNNNGDGDSDINILRDPLTVDWSVCKINRDINSHFNCF